MGRSNFVVDSNNYLKVYLRIGSLNLFFIYILVIITGNRYNWNMISWYVNNINISYNKSLSILLFSHRLVTVHIHYEKYR